MTELIKREQEILERLLELYDDENHDDAEIKRLEKELVEIISKKYQT